MLILQKMNIPKLPVFTTEEGIKRIKEFFGKLNDWINIDELLPNKTLKSKNSKRTGKAGIFTASLELVKEGNLSIKQKNLFDDIFSIEEVKIYKPSSKVYDMPVKKYSIKNEEVAFLSANTWDVSGGGNYGFTSIWVNRNKNIFDNLDYKPKNEISGLNQLIDIL